MRRRRPALGRAEELDERRARLGVVAAPRRVDVDLRRQRDGEDLAARGLGHAEARTQRRAPRGVRRPHVDVDAPANSGAIVAAACGGVASAARARAHALLLRAGARRTPRPRSRRASPPEMPSQRGLDHPHELVAAVDRARSRRRGGSTSRLTISASTSGSSSASTGLAAHELVPGLEVELALGRAGRARVERDDARRRRSLHEEEGQADRDLELRPTARRRARSRPGSSDARPGRAQVGLARAHGEARLAGAQDPALADVAAGGGGPRTSRAPQRSQRVVAGARPRPARRRRPRARHAPQAGDDLAR